MSGSREREEDEEKDEEEEEAETSRGELGPRVLSADWQTPAYILHAPIGTYLLASLYTLYRRNMTAHQRTLGPFPRTNPSSE